MKSQYVLSKRPIPAANMAQLAFSVSQSRPVQTQFRAPVRSATRIKRTATSVTGGSQAARLAAASAVAFLCRRPDVRHAKLAAKGSSTLAATAKTVDAKVFSDAWEKALDGREGNVFTEPEMFMEVLEHLNQTHSQKGPVYFERVSQAADEKKDIVLYVPGIDFSGAFAAPQFRGLAADFELWRCWVKPGCRESFYEMARQLEAWLDSHENRKVVLLGESFGGLLSLAVALRLGREKLKGLVLVNPATSFDRTVWPLLGRVLAAVPNEPGNLPPMGSHKDLNELFEDIQSRATLSPYPYLAGSALTGTVADSTQLGRLFSRIGLQILNSGSTLDPSVENFLLYPENLAQLLPPETVKFRLRHWLRDGCEWVNSELRRRRGASFGGNALPPTCLVASDSDRLLMSDKEAKRLRGLLQARCGDQNLKVVELSESGHAPLDRRVKLAELLKDSPILKKVKGRNYVDEFEYPSLEVLEQGSRNIEPIAALASPVFCSWDAASGKRRFGLGGVPDPKELQRPIILVGNHQLFALDLGPLVREFLIEKGYSPRGLAHPINFPEVLRTLTSTKVTMEESGLLDSINLPFELRAAARALEASNSKSSNGISGPFGLSPPTEEQNAPQSELGVGENFGVGGAFAKWGAVPVSPRNFFRLLQRKEAILLFPGGAREACHGATEKYKLMWPKQTDFVRLAARFNAIVVPFGGIGSADNVRIGEDEASEQERQGFSEMMDGGMNVVSDSLREPPRFKPAPPRFPPATQTRAGFGDRFYFSFGAPVDLADVDPKDKDACEEVYQKLKGDVEGEINWLLEARVRDPNRDFITRQLKERVMNLDPQPKEVKAGPLKGNFIRSCGRRAPSFPLE